MTFYLTDGSEDCFYTAVFDCYADKQGVITSRRDVQLALDSEVKEVATDNNKATRVKKAHQKIETNIRTAFLPSRLKIGKPVAHAGFCLMLLGSPPDMVHSPTLHSTNLSSPAC